MTNLFNGLFDSQTTTVISVENFLLCIGVALILGIMTALCVKIKNSPSKSFLFALGILPVIVCMVIMMVNGNIGAGVAIAGAFALVRFRSAPGDAKQIVLVFCSMATGLIVGMGYIAYAVLFNIIMCLVFIGYTLFVDNKKDEKILKITIPEDLNYDQIFDDILVKYTDKYELRSVKTSNMGTLYKLTYNILLKQVVSEKKMMDELRCCNGNLEVSITKKEDEKNIL